MLKLDNITIAFGDHIVVKDLSYEFNEGETTHNIHYVKSKSKFNLKMAINKKRSRKEWKKTASNSIT